ncbi:MAG TPA: hypothetical protein VK678_25740, partial [Bradyrhizobium sp.]|nr:hypothetical protein [Bradyrhizobium sp.]
MLLTMIGGLSFGRWCHGFGLNGRQNGFGLNDRQRRLARISIEIGNRIGRFRDRGWPEFVRNRSGQTIIRPAAPAAAAPTSATARPSLAAWPLIGANHAGLLFAFVLVGFVLVAGHAGNPRGLGHHVRNFAFVACGRPAVTRLAGTTAPPPPPLALVAIGIGFAVARLADRHILRQPFGLFGFHFRLGFDVERLFVLGGFFDIGRESRNLRRQQRLGGLQRVHLFAAIDDERLLAGDGGIGDHRERDLEGVFEIAQVAAL